MKNLLNRHIFGFLMVPIFFRTEDGARRAQPKLGNVFYYTTITLDSPINNTLVINDTHGRYPQKITHDTQMTPL